MAAILVKEEITDLDFVFHKISSTTAVYTERYPEFMYVTACINSIKKQYGEEENLDLLVDLTKYMKDKLSEYNVIKIMQHELLQDVELLLAGMEVNREKDYYLTFLGA